MDIKYSKADLISFKILPPTCDAIDSAFNYTSDVTNIMNTVLSKYHIYTDTDTLQQIRYAIYEIVDKATHKLRYDTCNVVKYEGTFPLRLALVKMIERELSSQGIQSEKSMYENWLENSIHHTKKIPKIQDFI